MSGRSIAHKVLVVLLLAATLTAMILWLSNAYWMSQGNPILWGDRFGGWLIGGDVEIDCDIWLPLSMDENAWPETLLDREPFFLEYGPTDFYEHHLGTGRFVVRVMFPLWSVVLLTGVYPFIAFVRGPWRRFRRRTKGLCRNCGYNLRGLTAERCPDGTPFRDHRKDAKESRA